MLAIGLSPFGVAPRSGINAVTRPAAFDEATAIFDARGIRTLPGWAAAMTEVSSNLRDARIAFVGPSTTRGFGSFADTSADRAWDRSLPATTMANAAERFGLNTRINSFVGIGAMPGGALGDSRQAPGAGWSKIAETAGGGVWSSGTSGTSIFAFTPTEPFDAFDIIVTRNTSLGVMEVLVDGQVIGEIDTQGPAEMIRTTFDGFGPPDLYEIGVRRKTGGLVSLVGIVAREAGRKEVTQLNLGWHGSRTGDWVAGSGAFAPLNALAFHAPDLAVISIGLGDATDGVPLATYRANLQSIHDACRTGGGEALFVAPHRIDPNVVSEVVQATYATAMAEVAVANGVPFLDLTDVLGDHVALSSAGLLNSDGIHLNAGGVSVAAEALVALLEPGGAIDGAPVTSWEDQVSGMAAAQGAGIGAPTLGAIRTPGGAKAICFASARNQRLTVPAASATGVANLLQGGGSFLVVASAASAGTSGEGCGLSKGNDRYFGHDGADTSWQTIVDLSGGLRAYSFAGLPLDRWTTYAMTADAATAPAQSWVPGFPGAILAPTIPGSGTAVDNIGDDLVIGNAWSNSRAFDGHIAFIALWQTPLTAAQMHEAVTWAQYEFGAF